VGGQRYVPAVLPLKGYAASILQKAIWATGPVWT
jgi:hypothetical protein